MSKKPLSRFALVAAVMTIVVGTACAPGWAQQGYGPPPKPVAPCAWWYGIGEPPTAADLEIAAKRYTVVVLNATETAALRTLHELNPKIKVLVYKDLASARNYRGVVNGDVDATYLPTGIGYNVAQRDHPEWFALDTASRRIEWQGYSKHWQMTVWDTAYQQAWATAVTAEVVREGWDGVLADNDFSSLSHYSTALLAGTSTVAQTDRKLRDGFDALLAVAGDSLANADKMFVPNVSETRLIPGRWTAHSRYSGAMEENFGFRDDGTDELLTFQGNQFKELRGQAALGESWLLLVTRVTDDREERAGYATAALLAGPYTCWTPATTATYLDPEWSPLQNAGLGEATDTATRQSNGAWTRQFTNGWVAVNPTAVTVRLTPPEGLVDLSGSAVTSVELTAADGAVLRRPEIVSPPASPPA